MKWLRNLVATGALVKTTGNPLVAHAAIDIGVGTIAGAVIGGSINDDDTDAKWGGAVGGAVGGAMTGGLPDAILGAGAGGFVGYEFGDDVYNAAKSLTPSFG